MCSKYAISDFLVRYLRTLEDLDWRVERWLIMWQQGGTDLLNSCLDTQITDLKLICGLLGVLWVSWAMDSHYFPVTVKWTNFIWFKKYLALWQRNRWKASTKTPDSSVCNSHTSQSQKRLKNVIWRVCLRKHLTLWLDFSKWTLQRD